MINNFVFSIESLANDAFQDGNRDYEIARILRTIADRVESHGLDSLDGVPIRDINGNGVGVCVSNTKLGV